MWDGFGNQILDQKGKKVIFSKERNKIEDETENY